MKKVLKNSAAVYRLMSRVGAIILLIILITAILL
jgi:hypothetical protein